ncbi:hypothetical protein EIP91_010530 [Steccherinum ochraceum]|uniref:BTB domain-containing protein n=1 Tax=Steccherinum ochraceum TaxID=92696 RepID=A0A4R0R0I8_9APHY|nr:hypothetical protein EIP91_010530 [Steccherinum ochraceum]
MSDAHPAKRARIDEEDQGTSGPSSKPTEPTNYSRGEVWLDDGNVVLVAEGTAFRVLRSILCSNSDVFRDMFTIPQPTDAETWEGCPVVQLQDSKVDLVYVLRALFDSKNTDWFRYNHQATFEAVSALLRLGTKYQIEHLRQDAINRLPACFPSRLEDFAFAKPVEPPYGRWLYSNSSAMKTIPRPELSIAIVNLARSYDLLYLLPPAFYGCAYLPHFTLTHGFLDSDGHRWKLSQDDLNKCLSGAEQLRKICADEHRRLFFAKPSALCDIKHQCTNLLEEERQFLHDDDAPILAGRVSVLSDSSVMWFSSLDLCNDCVNDFTFDHSEMRQETWCRLHAIFDLEIEWPPKASGGL